MRFGIIGCGEIALKHRDAIQKMDGEVVIACDLDMDKCIDLFPSASKTMNYKNVIEDPDVEVVVICTPNYLHVPMALDALDAGKKVILEKPIATTIEDARALSRHPLADKNLTICFQRRFNNQAQDIKKYIDEHLYNPPVSVTANIFVRRDAPYWREWRNDPEKSGGANLMNIDVHYFDLLQWWLGKDFKVIFAKTAKRGGIDQITYANLDIEGVDVQFLGSAIHDRRIIDMSVKFMDDQVMSYTRDDGTHLDIYIDFLIKNQPITAKEALTSLEMVLAIYGADKE